MFRSRSRSAALESDMLSKAADSPSINVGRPKLAR